MTFHISKAELYIALIIALYGSGIYISTLHWANTGSFTGFFIVFVSAIYMLCDTDYFKSEPKDD